MGSNHDIAVLFGSQTGNAEDVAHRIAREAIKRHKSVLVSALDDYDIKCLPDEAFVVFVVSTTGNGDPPDNMKCFWKFIWKSALSLDSLTKLKYGVVGLGDSSYQRFNIVAKKLSKRLSQLGGDLVLPGCFGDDQHDMGYNAAINPWLKEFWDYYLEDHPIPSGLSILPSHYLLPSKFNIKFVDKGDGFLQNELEGNTQLKSYNAPVVGNKRVTSDDHWQDVRLITLDITGANIQYSPGDVCYIYPKNSQLNVLKFSELFEFDLDLLFILECPNFSSSLIPLGQPCTLRFLLENCLDICGSPRQYFWEVLAAVAGKMNDGSDKDNDNSEFRGEETEVIRDLMEREKLQEFLTPEGQDELFSYCYRPKRTILEVLSDFPQTRSKLTLPHLLDMIHQMKPRAYSIASSQLKSINHLEILVAVVLYKTHLVEPRRGLCSNYLSNLVAGEDRAMFYVDKGTLRFPRGNEVTIMVGPGTGCAPFRSFIEQRSILLISGNYLFFGCRSSRKDYFFKDEWEAKENEDLLKVFPAFSRDQDEKIYVQDLIEKQGPLLCNLLLHENAFFMLAGNSKNMPESVRNAVLQIFKTNGQMDQLESESYLNKMEQQRRYQSETWS